MPTYAYPKTPRYFPDHEPGRGRYFMVRGKKQLFHLRRQPANKMHGDWYDRVTCNNKYHAFKVIKKNLEKFGLTVRIVKVRTGYRVYWAYLPRKV